MRKRQHVDFTRLTYNSERGRKMYRKVQDDFFTRISWHKQVEFEIEEEIEGIRCLWTRPKQLDEVDGRVVFYCHGGGYNAGGIGYMKLLASKLAVTLKLPVIAHEYSLSPECPFPVAQEETWQVWQHLLKKGLAPEQIIVAGDSAGGNMALELCLRIKKQRGCMPGQLILLSPWTDLSMTGKSYTKYDGKDPILSKKYIMASRELYAPGADYKKPELSPIYGNLRGLPETLIQVGEVELLRSDSERLYQKMSRSGVNVSLHIYRKVWHVFQQMPLKKTKLALQDIEEFVKGESQMWK